MAIDTMGAGILTFILFIGLHYLPWPAIFGRPGVNPPWNYVAGVGWLGTCYSALMVSWWRRDAAITPALALLAFWAVVVGGGGAVLASYMLDAWLELRAKALDHDVTMEMGRWREESGEQG